MLATRTYRRVKLPVVEKLIHNNFARRIQEHYTDTRP